MLSEEEKSLIKKKRLEAMKRRLSSYDFCCFHNVPDFIIEAFYGKCTYKKRLMVSSFAYLNGITFEQTIEMQQWIDYSDADVKKIKNLMLVYFQKDSYKNRYYSFEVIRGLVCYLNGNVKQQIL